jgi:hypothetical protein
VAHEVSMPLARTLELVPVFPNRVHPVVDVAFLTPKRIDGTATPAPLPYPADVIAPHDQGRTQASHQR